MKTINIKKLFILSALFLALGLSSTYGQSAKSYKYETVSNDPLNARIYKLDNGLTVYMTVYKNEPRIQTYIATKAGSKNDPKDATGLAHYLEHMLFKGTDKFGSKDYAKEKIELDKIEALFELYRQTKDDAKRKEFYHQIDSISGVASKYAIANEYDKMLTNIGAKGTNAYTSNEQTVYVNDIPSNQLEKWLTIEAERFRNPVLRLFHTELEAVYEEKNRGLDSDSRKSWEALFAGLWPNNTYGSQTTIGTIDHLKNPSITEIKKYYNTYYVPNNMAICLSGDFDPDATIKLIAEKFGAWKSKPVPAYQPFIEKPITKPVIKEVVGPDAESVLLGYRFPGTGTKEADMLMLVNKLLSNGKAGLIDLNLNQQQRILEAGAFDMELKDYSAHIFYATAKEGQSLEQAKDLLLEQIEKLKAGDFPDWMLTAIVNDMKLEETKMYERNRSRADAFVSAFVTDTKWQDYVATLDRLSKITKQEIIDFVKANYKNNYVIVYKRTGEDLGVQKVVKPEITPVDVNRNDESPFLTKIKNTSVKEVQPVFLDYNKDITHLKTKFNIPVLFTPNTENKTFDMYYVLDMGTKNDKRIELAVNYLKYLGTKSLSAADFQQELYKLGCSVDVYAGEENVWVSIRGLTENIEKAVRLFEDLLANAQPNDEALKNLVADVIKTRADAKLRKSEILYGALFSYGKYGSNSVYKNILSTQELEQLKSSELIDIINKLTSYNHRVLYYGNNTTDQLLELLNNYHKVPEKLLPIPEAKKFDELEATGKVYVVDYDMKQAEVILFSKDGSYNKENDAMIRIFNEYFGGGMSSVVFQEMRESRALAYSVYCSYSAARKKDDANYVFAYIGTQADKLPEAMAGMMDLINKMPESENNLKASKEAAIQDIRSARIIKSSILFNYENAKKLGLDYDIRKDVFQKIPTVTLADVKAFEEKHLKSKKYDVLVLGKKENLDLKTLEKYGTVTFLSLQDIFGY
ncbi:MAG: insulinase family protein [Bacteroidia bacterium]